MAQANVKLTVDATNATRALQGVQNKTNALQKSFGGLKTAIGGIGIALLARQAVRTSANFEKLNVRLGLLTKASGTFARSQEIAANAQKAFGLSATEALEGITDITARLQPLGVGVEDIKSTFFGFNTAAKLAGASTIEASNAFRQLAQALGSGRLQGDEFRSISEQIPTLLKPISEELNVNIGDLKKFASEGKLTSEVVLRALRKIETDGSSSLKALVEADPTQVFKNLSNAVEDLSKAFGKKLNPVVMPAIKGLTELTQAAVKFIDSPIVQTAAIFTGVALAVKGFTTAASLLAAAQTILIAKFKLTTAGAIAYAKATSTASIVTRTLAISTGALTLAFKALPLVAVATGIGAIVTQLIKQKKAQDKVTDAIKKGELAQLRALESDLSIKMAKEFGIINSSNDKRSIAAAEKRLALLRKQFKPIRDRINEVIKENAEIDKTNQKLKEKKDLLDKNAEAAKKLKEKFDEIGKSIEQNLVQNLTDAVMGAQTLGQALSNVLKGIQRQLIEMAVQSAVGGIGGLFSNVLSAIFNPTPNAMGGPVSAGGSFLVGEKGPELFVPQKSGTIVPNHALAGTTNVVVNVDASGSAVQGDDDSAAKLGEVIASAVQAEIVNQQMAGGLLS